MFRLFLFSLFLSNCVLSKHIDPLFSPCSLNDLESVQKSTTELLTSAAEGLDAPYDIKPVDPIEVPSKVVPLCCEKPPKRSLRLEDTKIYGFKNIQVLGITMNQQTKKAVANFTTDLKLISKITDVNDSSVTGEGEIKAKTKHQITYDFDMIKDNDGVEFLDIGQEKTTCELIDEIQVKLSPDTFKNAIENDLNFAENAAKIAEERKSIVCEAALIGVKRAMQAFRQSAKVIPTSKLFKV